MRRSGRDGSRVLGSPPGRLSRGLALAVVAALVGVGAAHVAPVAADEVPPVPFLSLAVAPTAPVGRPVEVTVVLAPSPAEATASLAGTIQIVDVLSGDVVPVLTGPDPTGLGVGASAPAPLVTSVALPEGEYALRAVYTPASDEHWGSTLTEGSPLVVHGPTIPTALRVVGDSTQGTGLVPTGADLYLDVRLDPGHASALNVRPAQVAWTSSSGGSGSVTLDATGRGSVAIAADGHSDPGPSSVTLSFDPAGAPDGGNPGLAPSEVTFSYQVIDPATAGPVATATSGPVVAPRPVPQGLVWSSVVSHVTHNAPGSVTYTARNVDTSVVTALGTASVVTSTSATLGRGRAALQNPAATASLPAGVYEVTGQFTPNNPALFTSSASEPVSVSVLPVGAGVMETGVALTATRLFPVDDIADRSTVGDAVALSASVVPAWVQGTISFLSGETEIAQAAVPDGRAEVLVWDLAVGVHSLIASFAPLMPETLSGSASPASDFEVVAAPVVTAPPEDASVTAGQQATFTATATGAVRVRWERSPDGETWEPATDPAWQEVEGGEVSLTFTAGTDQDGSSYRAVLGNAAGTTVTSGPATLSVATPSATTVSVLTPDPVVVGTDVEVEIAVAPVPAGGTVQVEVDGEPVGPALALDPATGRATATLPGLGVGDHQVTAGFSGHAPLAPSTSPVATVTVVKRSSTVDVSVDPVGGDVDDEVTFAAEVGPTSAGGTVQFSVDAVPVGGPVPLVDGRAVSEPRSGWPAGTHTVVAAYSGDAEHEAEEGEASFRPSAVAVAAVGPDLKVAGRSLVVTVSVDPARSVARWW